MCVAVPCSIIAELSNTANKQIDQLAVDLYQALTYKIKY